MIRAIVVDDEPLARWRIRNMLDDERDISLIAEAESGEGALHLIEDQQPDLVFLDVQMQTLSGFDVIEAVGPDAMPPTIFITAYEKYALRAFEVQALDYVLKPFDRRRFAQVVERARHRLVSPGGRCGAYDGLLGSLGPRHHLVARSQGRARIILLTDIVSIASAGNYSEICTGARAFLMNDSLTSLETRLPPKEFVRVHRSAIVRLDKILEIRLGAHGDGVIQLEGGSEIRLSRRYRAGIDAFVGR